MAGLLRNWRKIIKNGLFSAKIHHKSGYDSKFRELEEGTILKTEQQTSVHPQVIFVPKMGKSLRTLFLCLSNSKKLSKHKFEVIMANNELLKHHS